MKISTEQPPNIAEIRLYMTPPQDAVFAYGDTIYCPSGDEIPPDVIIHEEVHQKQQENYSSPEFWWTKYLLDPQFRYEQELEAYGEQYRYVSAHISTKGQKEALLDFATNLATIYGIPVSVTEAEAKIRLMAKELAKKR